MAERPDTDCASCGGQGVLGPVSTTHGMLCPDCGPDTDLREAIIDEIDNDGHLRLDDVLKVVEPRLAAKDQEIARLRETLIVLRMLMLVSPEVVDEVLNGADIDSALREVAPAHKAREVLGDG